MVQHKPKAHPASTRSMIDHTTTCPYCGHRILHKNRTSHIKRQHPDRYESDALTAKLDKSRKPATCSYCQINMAIEELEAHIQKFHRSAISEANAKIREKERVERAEKRKRRLKMTREYEAQLAYSTRVDAPIKPSPSPKSKPKKTSLPAVKKLTPESDKKAKKLAKIAVAIASKAPQEPVRSRTTDLTILTDFRCSDCGRDVSGQTIAQHQKADFLLRTKVRWLLNGRNLSTVVQCPLCEIELIRSAFATHLEEKHPVLFRYAVG